MGTVSRCCRTLALGAALVSVACTRAPAPDASPTPGAATGPVDWNRPLPSPLPNIAAKVNGQPIVIQRVALAAREEQARVKDRTQPDPRALRNALQRLIVRELLFQEALARGLKAETRVVERAYDAARGRHGSDMEWHLFLNEHGLTADEYRTELRLQATVDALHEQVAAGIDPAGFPEPEVRAFYEAHPQLSETQPPAPFGEVEPRVRVAMAQLRASERIEALVRELEARAEIEVFL